MYSGGHFRGKLQHHRIRTLPRGDVSREIYATPWKPCLLRTRDFRCRVRIKQQDAVLVELGFCKDYGFPAAQTKSSSPFVRFGKIPVEIAFVPEIELHEVTIRRLTLLEPKRPENMDVFFELREVVSDGWWI